LGNDEKENRKRKVRLRRKKTCFWNIGESSSLTKADVIDALVGVAKVAQAMALCDDEMRKREEDESERLRKR